MLLKELGFPQDQYRGGWRYSRHGRGDYRVALVATDSQAGFLIKDFLACPSLEDLIGWLGESFDGLTHIPNTGFQAEGHATNGLEKGYCIDHGKKSLEAVFNLCVALKGGE